MRVVVIAEAKNKSIELLLEKFEDKKIEASYIRLSKLALLTEGKKTEVIADSVKFANYDAVFISAEPTATPFVEPLLVELQDRGIYCNARPESFYLTANKPYMYSALISKGISAPATRILASPALVDEVLPSTKFPVFFKAYASLTQTQLMKVNSSSALKSVAKSLQGKTDAVVIQDFAKGDRLQCAVIGKEVYAYRQKWDDAEAAHTGKPQVISLSDKEKQLAIKAANNLGLDIATVKLVNGMVVDVSAQLNIEGFNKVLSKELEKAVVDYYQQMTGAR